MDDLGALQQRLLPLWPPPTSSLMRQAAVLVLLHGDPAQPRVLLTRRSAHLRHHAGQVAFPGGMVEADDPSPLHTALRETREEVGLRLAEKDVLGRLPSMETLTGFEVHPYVGWSARPGRCHLQDGEVASVFHVPVAELAAAGLQPIRVTMTEPVVQSVAFRTPWSSIWGVTARILDQLIQRLQS